MYFYDAIKFKSKRICAVFVVFPWIVDLWKKFLLNNLDKEIFGVPK